MFGNSSQHSEQLPEAGMPSVVPSPQMQWDNRREQMSAFANSRTPPMMPGSSNVGWTPPVAYMPVFPGHIPALFTKDTYAHMQEYKREPSVPLDPTVAPEIAAQFNGATLQGEQWQRQPNVNVRNLTDTLLITAPYRTGDPTTTPPYAFMPGNEDMSAPVGVVLPGIKNKYILTHISDIHMTQQASLQKNIDKQLLKKGKSKGKSKDKGKQESEDPPETQTIF